MCGGTYWVQDIAIRQLVGRGQRAGQHGQIHGKYTTCIYCAHYNNPRGTGPISQLAYKYQSSGGNEI